jgi:hypothetical protein
MHRNLKLPESARFLIGNNLKRHQVLHTKLAEYGDITAFGYSGKSNFLPKWRVVSLFPAK